MSIISNRPASSNCAILNTPRCVSQVSKKKSSVFIGSVFENAARSRRPHGNTFRPLLGRMLTLHYMTSILTLKQRGVWEKHQSRQKRLLCNWIPTAQGSSPARNVCITRGQRHQEIIALNAHALSRAPIRSEPVVAVVTTNNNKNSSWRLPLWAISSPPSQLGVAVSSPLLPVPSNTMLFEVWDSSSIYHPYCSHKRAQQPYHRLLAWFFFFLESSFFFLEYMDDACIQLNLEGKFAPSAKVQTNAITTTTTQCQSKCSPHFKSFNRECQSGS